MTMVSRNDPARASQTAEEFAASPTFTDVSREVVPAPPRYRHEIGKYSVFRAENCTKCGLCVELCPHDVHGSSQSYDRIMGPFDYKCIGPDCADTDHYCVEACPSKAISIRPNPIFETFGDYRWTTLTSSK